MPRQARTPPGNSGANLTQPPLAGEEGLGDSPRSQSCDGSPPQQVCHLEKAQGGLCQVPGETRIGFLKPGDC
ncbi:Pituitary Tumor-Transforming 1 Protein-Interacting Protein [Manis pentadactyla]|nr:Pituitary Tumor-Transforming 1 Protein-Interacting Protein [Manis pentadactyla]